MDELPDLGRHRRPPVRPGQCREQPDDEAARDVRRQRAPRKDLVGSPRDAAGDGKPRDRAKRAAERDIEIGQHGGALRRGAEARQHLVVQPAVAAGDDVAALRGIAALPVGDDAAGALDDRDQRDDVIGLDA